MLAPWKKSYDQPTQHIKKQRHYFADKGLYNQSYGFSSSHAWMWELDHKKSWAENWCFWTVWCWRRLLRVPWTPKRSNQSILNEISPDYSDWILEGLNIERTDAEAPILWPPDVKSWLTGKDPNARKNWRQEEKGMTEVEMVRWHHQLDRHESEQAPGAGDGQGSLACCSPWGRNK